MTCVFRDTILAIKKSPQKRSFLNSVPGVHWFIKNQLGSLVYVAYIYTGVYRKTG